ncbi:MAG: SDR family NAD(P)-dependent oxidoreductase [Hyphomicrobiales bacterium]|nr:SDR family NAD(P)-dependent oxidoreductase [Hyphomicrobiales bacterium]
MDLKLSGRSALVTGSSKGIGLAVAQWLAREGVHVALVARSADRLEQEAAALRKATNVTVRTLAADLADAAARQRVAETFPDVDILINNAGAIPGGTIDEVDEAAWRVGWELKVFGYISLTRLFLQKMKARRRGVIVNVIGAGGERLDYGYIAGAAGNAGLMGFTRAIGGNSPNFGVRVIGVNPGPVLTDRIEVLGRKRAARLHGDENRWREGFAELPFGRPASTDEIAAMVVFLASDLSAYTSGTIVTIDGGLTNRS